MGGGVNDSREGILFIIPRVSNHSPVVITFSINNAFVKSEGKTLLLNGECSFSAVDGIFQMISAHKVEF